MTTPTQLSLYNGALLLLGEGKLASLSENREPRHVLDDIWDRRAVDYCLRQGLWNFAIRAVESDYDATIEPSFGFQYVFGKPSDWVKTAAVASDEYFRALLTGFDYRDEAGNWLSNHNKLYIRYVSNDSDYGADYTLWTPDFERFVEAYLAKNAGPRIKGVSAERLEAAETVYDKLEGQAKSADAADDGPGSPPNGSWAQSRMRGQRSRRHNIAP